MNSMNNRAMLIGNVGQDPEIKTLESGKQMAKFSLATTERWKDKAGEKKEETTWHTCIVFEPLAAHLSKFVHKGDKIAVTGKIVNRSYALEDGTKRYVSEIRVSEIEALVWKEKGTVTNATNNDLQ